MDQQPQQPAQMPDPNSMPALDLNGNFLHPEALQGMINGMDGQNFMADASMGGYMPMSNEQLMVPLMHHAVNGHTQPSQAPKDLNADEIALYDRQIRLWGVAAQAKIQSANILLITVKSLANEIAKNLVLSGIASLTILDDQPVSESDLGAQFFLSEEDPSSLIGKNRAQAAAPAIQKLNPRVKVHVDTEGVTSKGSTYFGGFDVVIATDLMPDALSLVNTATRVHKRAFYAASTHGLYGFIFNDLIEHDFVITRDQGNVPTSAKSETRTRSITSVSTRKEGPKTIETVTKKELYSTWILASDGASLPDDYLRSKRRLRAVTPALSCLQALWEFTQATGGRLPANRGDLAEFTRLATQKHKALSLPGETLTSEFMRSFLQNLGSEIAPVTAILGGQLAQDVINVLSQKEQPIQNMVVFDGGRMEALMVPLHPQGMNLGVPQLEGGGMGGGMGGGVDMSMMGFDPSMGGFHGTMPMGMDGMGGFPQGMGNVNGMDGQMNGTFHNQAPQESAPVAPQGQAAQRTTNVQSQSEPAAAPAEQPKTEEQAPNPEAPVQPAAQ